MATNLRKRLWTVVHTHVIVEKITHEDDDRIIIVDDVLKTLQQLALHHRRQFILSTLGKNNTLYCHNRQQW